MVSLVSRSIGENGNHHIFSVSTPGQTDAVRFRTVVQHRGLDDGTGSWTCAKDGITRCAHTTQARHALQKLIQQDPTARDQGISYQDPSVSIGRTTLREMRCVSYLPILPPIWATLPTDKEIYLRPPPVRVAPPIIPLHDNGRCSCGATKQHNAPVITSPCTIFTLSASLAAQIELQVCKSCSGGRYRHIGSDGRTLGLFNYNNRLLFAHDLLDEYTMAYTSSETPFVAWVGVLSRRYSMYSSKQKFVSEEIFRDAWFAYSRLQALDGDMMCPTCGPTPDDVIWDGVTLAFGKKHLLPTLRPPTAEHSDSLQRNSRYLRDQTLIPDRKLRKLVQTLLVRQASTIVTMPDEDYDVADDLPEHATLTNEAVLGEIQIRLDTAAQLNGINPALGNLFTQYFGISTIAAGRQVPTVYIKLFKQVCHGFSIV